MKQSQYLAMRSRQRGAHFDNVGQRADATWISTEPWQREDGEDESFSPPQQPHLYMHPDEVMQYANPYNEHVPQQMDRLRDSIATHGMQRPVTINSNGVKALLDDGHHRALAAQQLGLDKIPVIVDKTADGYFEDSDPDVRGTLKVWHQGRTRWRS